MPTRRNYGGVGSIDTGRRLVGVVATEAIRRVRGAERRQAPLLAEYPRSSRSAIVYRRMQGPDGELALRERFERWALEGAYRRVQGFASPTRGQLELSCLCSSCTRTRVLARDHLVRHATTGTTVGASVRGTTTDQQVPSLALAERIDVALHWFCRLRVETALGHLNRGRVQVLHEAPRRDLEMGRRASHGRCGLQVK